MCCQSWRDFNFAINACLNIKNICKWFGRESVALKRYYYDYFEIAANWGSSLSDSDHIWLLELKHIKNGTQIEVYVYDDCKEKWIYINKRLYFFASEIRWCRPLQKICGALSLVPKSNFARDDAADKVPRRTKTCKIVENYRRFYTCTTNLIIRLVKFSRFIKL